MFGIHTIYWGGGGGGGISRTLILRDLQFCGLFCGLKLTENIKHIFCFVSMVTIYCSSDFANRLAKFDQKATHVQIPVITTILEITH